MDFSTFQDCYPIVVGGEQNHEASIVEESAAANKNPPSSTWTSLARFFFCCLTSGNQSSDKEAENPEVARQDASSPSSFPVVIITPPSATVAMETTSTIKEVAKEKRPAIVSSFDDGTLVCTAVATAIQGEPVSATNVSHSAGTEDDVVSPMNPAARTSSLMEVTTAIQGEPVSAKNASHSAGTEADVKSPMNQMARASSLMEVTTAIQGEPVSAKNASHSAGTEDDVESPMNPAARTSSLMEVTAAIQGEPVSAKNAPHSAGTEADVKSPMNQMARASSLMEESLLAQVQLNKGLEHTLSFAAEKLYTKEPMMDILVFENQEFKTKLAAGDDSHQEASVYNEYILSKMGESHLVGMADFSNAAAADIAAAADHTLEVVDISSSKELVDAGAVVVAAASLTSFVDDLEKDDRRGDLGALKHSLDDFSTLNTPQVATCRLPLNLEQKELIESQLSVESSTTKLVNGGADVVATADATSIKALENDSSENDVDGNDSGENKGEENTFDESDEKEDNETTDSQHGAEAYDQEARDLMYDRNFEKAIGFAGHMGFENPVPIGSGGYGDVFRVQKIDNASETAILKIFETESTFTTMVNVSRRNEAESANDDEGGDDKDDEELQGRVEMVPMELLVLQECQRQMLGATVRLTQSMMFEEENETYYAVLMPDLGPRTMSLAEFNRYPRNELRAHKVKKIFQNICKQVRLFQKLGLFHGDLKEDNILINEDTFEVIMIDFGSVLPMSLKNRFSRVFKGTTRSPENVENDWIHIGEAEELHALGALLRELLFRHRIWNGNEMGPEILKEHRESLDRKPEFADLLSDLDLLMNIDPAERGTFETLDSLKSLACAKFHTRHVEPFRLEAVASETELLPFIDHLGVETTEEVITALEFHLI